MSWTDIQTEVKNYDKEKNCDKLCPLECESTQYKISESIFSNADFSDSEQYNSEEITRIEKKLNITINSAKELNKNILQLQVIFDSLKYTKITQTPKTTLSALISNLGGSQEYNLRAGTENVMAIYSMKVALNEIYEEKIDCEENLIKYFEGKLKEIVSPKDLTIFSENGQRIWNTSYFAISGLDAKTQLMFYNSNKVYVGTGSACSAGLDEDSYVLSAMGFDEQIRKCAVRVSLSVVSKKKDIDILLEKLQQLYERFK